MRWARWAGWFVAGGMIALGPGDEVVGQAGTPPERFAGTEVPDPPQQRDAWGVPATRLPRFLVTATGLLFDQGVADPRGCEYRAVEIASGPARGFVLPERPGVPGRFVVAWDGMIYPVVRVDAALDLGREVAELAAHIKKTREARQADPPWRGAGWRWPAAGPPIWRDQSGVSDQSPLKVCLLLRLGRADLAEPLFAAGTSWTAEQRGRDLTDYGVTYLSLASDWAAAAFGRLIGAHERGDDAIALDAARRLVRFRDLATRQADAMGFPRPDQQGGGRPGPALRFHFLGQLDDLLRDHEHRAALGPRGLIPPRGGDPSARIAAQIRDLDQIDERQMSSPGAAHPGGSWRVGDLIAEGDAAVEPILAALATEARLTRSVDMDRGMSLMRYVHPVAEAEFEALVRILKTNEFQQQRYGGWKTGSPDERVVLVAAIRQFWLKNRSVALADRWYRTLCDDGADAPRWLEAAGGIASAFRLDRPTRPGRAAGPLQGEPLRQGRDPSVTTLMLRRAATLERAGDEVSGLAGASAMATHLAAWDGPAALPLLRSLVSKYTIRAEDEQRKPNTSNPDRSSGTNVSRFTMARDRLGDREALDDYARWLRTTTPSLVEHGQFEPLEPVFDHPDHPAIAAAVRALFLDPKSPWLPLVADARPGTPSFFPNLPASPLVLSRDFRAALFTALADRTPIGTQELDDRRSVQRRIRGKPSMSYGSSDLTFDGVVVGREYPFRICDDVAFRLAALEGAPRFDLFGSEPRRDEGVAAAVAYLRRYGEHYTMQPPPDTRDFPQRYAHLAFAELDHPATPEDVAAGRAIFSLGEEGAEVRRAALFPVPLKARWTTLQDTPVDQIDAAGVKSRGYDTTGVVWQAEEIRRGDRWERFYGFVSRHTIARAPAAEVEFGAEESRWARLPAGLDSSGKLVEHDPEVPFRPGQGVEAALLIRNRRGVANTAASEFVRPGPDGLPAFRRGIGLTLVYSPLTRDPGLMSQRPPERPIELKRPISQFDPGPATRPLEPLEEFEAFRLKVDDWFDLSAVGSYRLQINLEDEPKARMGSWSGQVFFRVLAGD